MRKLGIPAILLACTALLLWAEKRFNPPPAHSADTYPAHETHADERVSIAIDPYDTPEKASAFGVKYKDYGFLPVRLIISNQSDKTLMLDRMEIEFMNSNRDRLQPATKEDLLRRISNPERIGQPGPTIPLPIPGQKKRKQPISTEARDEIELAPFVSVPITPHSTASGFLFFDVAGIRSPEEGAHISFSGIREGDKELFYFDIPLQEAGQPPTRDKK